MLVSMTRPTRRAIAFAPLAHKKLVASTGFAVIRKCESVIQKQYLLEVLRSELCSLQFAQRSSGGNYPAITEEQLLRCVIPVPPRSVQHRIVEKVSAIREEAKRLKYAAAEALSAVKTSMENQILRK